MDTCIQNNIAYGIHYKLVCLSPFNVVTEVIILQVNQVYRLQTFDLTNNMMEQTKLLCDNMKLLLERRLLMCCS